MTDSAGEEDLAVGHQSCRVGEATRDHLASVIKIASGKKPSKAGRFEDFCLARIAGRTDTDSARDQNLAVKSVVEGNFARSR